MKGLLAGFSLIALLTLGLTALMAIDTCRGCQPRPEESLSPPEAGAGS